ncbi:hypothetical protein CTAYLR_002484 [Chrysophaeum taylorii]|uniref:Uncharacterized protein n=1 Tax=Chrysophaeum taylorii TaxID=2483200 RepID=A0AAD7UF51_9STRA|nr:hypothetical protein CTAYLR_002484 [Chrysophaeum taylorii]
MKWWLATIVNLGTAFVVPPRPKLRTVVNGGGGGEVAKDVVIVTWLFGGLIPALGAANAFAWNKLRASKRYEGFVASGEGRVLPLASLGAADAVLAEDVDAALKRVSAQSLEFQPLSLAMQAQTATASSAPVYVSKTAFKARCRKAVGPKVGDAALDAIFDAWSRGSGFADKKEVDAALARWRNPTGDVDFAAFDRDALLGRATILAGFAGLAAIDLAVVFAFIRGVQAIMLKVG